MPEKAAGTTTSRRFIRVAPSAYAPSRSPLGTLRSASSESDETSGRIMIPITIPGLNALNPARPGTNRCSGRHEQQREVAVDDGRHAGEQLEHGLTMRRSPAGACSLR